MLKYLYIFFLIFFVTNSNGNNKEKIINNLKNTKNVNFEFEQNINKKIENGNCVIKYPKKIYCEYNNVNKKIIVSNGKSLVIKNRNSGTFYLYPLEKTPLKFLLDKKYLIKKMRILKSRNINEKYINFKLLENNNEINIFFSKETLNLIGWQIEDIYQNLTITFISSIKINEKINDDIFILPKKD